MEKQTWGDWQRDSGSWQRIPRVTHSREVARQICNLCLVGGWIFFSCLASVGAQPVSATGTLTVSGEAELRIVPDIAHILVGINSQADSAAAAATSNAEAVNKVIEVLKAEGIAAGDLQTGGFSLAPRYNTSRAGAGEQPRVVAFVTNTHLNVKLRELTKLGTLVDRILTAGATNVRIATLDVADRERFIEDLRRRAVNNGKLRASVYAAAAGVVLGSLLSFSEDSSPLNGVSGSLGGNEAMGSASATIEPGEVISRLRVQMTWKIEPK